MFSIVSTAKCWNYHLETADILENILQSFQFSIETPQQIHGLASQNHRDEGRSGVTGRRNVSFSGLPHRGVSVVDDLSHEVGEEDGLGDDGEPGEQVTDAQPQQLRRHLQHGEPQQPHGGLGLSQVDRRRSHRRMGIKKKEKRLFGFGFSPRPPRSPCPRWRSWCSRCGSCSSAGSASCAGPPLRTGRSCCATA